MPRHFMKCQISPDAYDIYTKVIINMVIISKLYFRKKATRRNKLSLLRHRHEPDDAVKAKTCPFFWPFIFEI